MAMGITYDEFWTLNPRKIKVILESYKLRRQIEDERQWLLGGYMFDAISVALDNAFKKKGQKAKNYFEVREKPYLKEIKHEAGLSEEEIQKKRELLMAQLRVRQANYELKKGK